MIVASQKSFSSPQPHLPNQSQVPLFRKMTYLNKTALINNQKFMPGSKRRHSNIKKQSSSNPEHIKEKEQGGKKIRESAEQMLGIFSSVNLEQICKKKLPLEEEESPDSIEEEVISPRKGKGAIKEVQRQFLLSVKNEENLSRIQRLNLKETLSGGLLTPKSGQRNETRFAIDKEAQKPEEKRRKFGRKLTPEFGDGDTDGHSDLSKHDFIEVMRKEGLLEDILGLIDSKGSLSYYSLKQFFLPRGRVPSFKALYFLRLAEREIASLL